MERGSIDPRGAELWIRLVDGRSFCERYEEVDFAWRVRRAMLDSLSHGDPISCEHGDIPADAVDRIDFVTSPS